MKHLAVMTLLLALFCTGCEVFKPNQDYSTIPATNNPHIIIDSNRGSAGF